MQTNKKTNPSEEQECFAFMDWVNKIGAKRYPELVNIFHVPNGEKREKVTFRYRIGNDWKTMVYSPAGKKLKKLGAKSGIPDYILLVPRNGYHGFIREFKALKGKPTPEQLHYLEAWGRLGYDVGVCYGAAHMIADVENYFKD